jgi:FKBP-type peptidyl-prolyl cis-trans isomerase
MSRCIWIVFALSLFLTVGCGEKTAEDKSQTTETPKQETEKPEAKNSETGKTEPPPTDEKVQIEDIKVGEGEAAQNDDLVLVTYTGKLKDGTEFDSNAGPDGEPFAVQIGVSPVIQGWHEGLVGMKKGGVRKLTIPYMKAYGEAGSPPKIPAKADLIFEITCLYVVKKGEEGVYEKKDIKEGSGPAVKNGDRVTVHYVGKLLNGKKFDSSRDRGEPFEFTVGEKGVIAGWDAGVVGMKKGGIRRLIIPPAIAYGPGGSPPVIGPNQVLDFEIELLKINGK